MDKPIYIVGGSKGGVGKSMIATALIDHLQEHGESVFLIESDTSNPDVWKAHRETLQNALIDLDKADGWVDLINVCDGNPGCTVVVNTAARNNAGVTRYGTTLESSLGDLKRNLVTLWVINRQRDSIELLKSYAEAISSGSLHVVRNGYFGDEQKFELYNGSKTRAAIEERGGKSITFPDLADRVSDDLYSRRLSIEEALKTLPIGNRAELIRWRKEMRKVLAEVAG